MDKRYVSFDVESSGKSPGKYSMLSIGACIVGDTSIQFYRELKPLNLNYLTPAMKIGCLGLYCLKDSTNPELNPKHEQFNPKKTLELMMDVCEDPKKVMADYAQWVLNTTKGFVPIEAAAPIKFDGMFSTWYFDNFFDGENPFGHRGEDINSMYRGFIKNISSHVDNGITR